MPAEISGNPICYPPDCRKQDPAFRFFASGNKVSMEWIKTGGVQEFVEVIKSRMVGSSSPGPTPTQTSDDPLTQLEKLGKLRVVGVISESESESKKAKILEQA